MFIKNVKIISQNIMRMRTCREWMAMGGNDQGGGEQSLVLF